ncbi:MAG: aminomethyl-transferring glycine dehydrogenase subunit GcvPA [Chloroflexi bacterium]|nr:aminomethyl-transferring glycine dehydrogenase subunit GcvPA [Chloroflexota bacterium]
MTYIPHTPENRATMLSGIGVSSIDELFEVIPEALRDPEIVLPPALSELEVMAELREMADRNANTHTSPCFLGAGAYNHFIPSAVSHIANRSEFVTAYTPYQPEIAQGTLQVIFEYQSMICALTGMEVSNASHYDGATSLAEAILMASNIARGKRTRVLLNGGINPMYLQTVRTYTQGTDLELESSPLLDGDVDALAERIDGQTACVAVQLPDFAGRLFSLEKLADAAHRHGALLIVVQYPIALGMLKPAGAYGADIVVGDGQPLGNALSFGGPYLGYMACRREHVRRLSGRLVGETVDTHGRRGFVLTLSAREQHIRREKATSNICSNQGLNMLVAAMYMAAMGKNGLRQVAELCYHKAHYAASEIAKLPGYRLVYDAPFFNEFIIECPANAEALNKRLYEEYGIIGGYALGSLEARLEHQMLVCVTEMNTADQIERLLAGLKEVVQ